MSSKNNGRNQIMVPHAREAMNKFKMEAANEVGVDLKQGYNGELTSRQAGSIGGQMVKNDFQYGQLPCKEPAEQPKGTKLRLHMSAV